MSRLPLIAGAVVLLVAAWAAAPPVSYLGAWLFWAGLAIGALPVLLALEAAGGTWAPGLIAPLRLLVRFIPVAALLLIPVLTRLHPLYPWTDGHRPAASFGRDWLQPGFFIGRSIVYLAIWSLLALVFGTQAPPGHGRRGLSLAGLAIHLVVGTLAAVDWAMSIDPDWHSGEFGLLLIASQSAAAVAAAVLLAGLSARGAPGEMPRGAGTLLVLTASIWAYVHFIRYLVTWSGDLPKEVAWYVARGTGVAWFGFLAGLVVPCLLVLTGRRGALMAASVLVLAAHLIGTMWLITPSVRGRFVLGGMDILALAALGAMTLAVTAALAPSGAFGRRRERSA